MDLDPVDPKLIDLLIRVPNSVIMDPEPDPDV